MWRVCLGMGINSQNIMLFYFLWGAQKVKTTFYLGHSQKRKRVTKEDIDKKKITICLGGVLVKNLETFLLDNVK